PGALAILTCRTVDEGYERELKTNFAGIKKYQQNTYYAGTWKPEYDRWVEMAAGMYQGEGREQVAWSQALTYDMVYTQPVVHEFGQLRVPRSEEHTSELQSR